MTHWERFAYSFAFTIAVSALILIGLAFVSKDIAYAFLYDYYWAGIFVIAYLLAPLARQLFRKDSQRGDT